MKLSIQDLMSGEDTLFGAAAGRVCLSRLLESVEEPSAPTLLFLDFDGVATATVSFLREGPIAFRDFLGGQSSQLYPVFANLAPPVADSLRDFLETTGDAVFACDLSEDEAPANPRVIGRLEPMQRVAFDAVRERPEATAAELAEERDGETVGITAWNNRLASLVAKRLLVEGRKGRSKVFRAALEQGV